MLITDVGIVERDGCPELHATVRCETEWMCDGRPFQVWYRFPPEWGQFLSAERADPFLAAFLGPAMVLGEPLEIEAAASPRLLRAVEDIQEIFRNWYPALHHVPLKIPAASSQTTQTGRTANGLFFSLGVDSAYCVLKNLQRHPCDAETLTHFITVIGFDLYLRENARFSEVRQNVQQVADALGKQQLVVWTNLREFSDLIADWPKLYHGAALASIGLALGEAFGRIHIAATTTYEELYPFGSHPLVDPLWSTERLTFVHDGCEANRMEKVRRIAESPLLLERLRVCVGDRGPEVYNCGTCWKCVMTTIALQAVGALDRCPTLPQTIDLERFREIDLAGQEYYWFEVFEALGTSGLEGRIKAMLAQYFEDEEQLS